MLRQVLSLAFATLAVGHAALGALEDLANAPWIGDGRPVLEGADWYAEDPAPEFCAEFTLPEGPCFKMVIDGVKEPLSWRASRACSVRSCRCR